jgi:hypothetical protein
LRFTGAAGLDRVLKQQLKTLLADGHELLGVLIDRSPEVLACLFYGFDLRHLRDAAIPAIATHEREQMWMVHALHHTTFAGR